MDKITWKEGWVEIAGRKLPWAHLGDLQKGQPPLLSSESPMLLDLAYCPLAASAWNLKLEGQRMFLNGQQQETHLLCRNWDNPTLHKKKCCVTAKLWQILKHLLFSPLHRCLVTSMLKLFPWWINSIFWFLVIPPLEEGIQKPETARASSLVMKTFVHPVFSCVIVIS